MESELLKLRVKITIQQFGKNDFFSGLIKNLCK